MRLPGTAQRGQLRAAWLTKVKVKFGNAGRSGALSVFISVGVVYAPRTQTTLKHRRQEVRRPFFLGYSLLPYVTV